MHYLRSIRWCLVLATMLMCTGCLMINPNAKLNQATTLGPPIRNSERRFRRYVKSWVGLKTENVVMQQRDYSCGAAALATLLRYHLNDKSATENKLIAEIILMLSAEEMKERIQNGLSLTDLRSLAVRLGYQASIGRLEFEKLRGVKIPLIVGIVINDFDHFVVYRGVDDKYVYLADPARGNVRTPIGEFKEQWQENAILAIIKRGEAQPKNSPLLVQPEESFKGRQNQLYLRRQITKSAIPF